MESMSLYNITGRFYELMARAAHDETLTEQELAEQQEELTGLITQKAPGLISYYRSMEVWIEAAKTEIDRLTEIKQRMERNQARYKQYIKENMERMGIAKIETPLGSMTIAKSPVSVIVTDIDALPNEYRIEKLTISADKKAIADHFKETGEMLPGCEVEVFNTNLRIK